MDTNYAPAEYVLSEIKSKVEDAEISGNKAPIFTVSKKTIVNFPSKKAPAQDYTDKRKLCLVSAQFITGLYSVTGIHKIQSDVSRFFDRMLAKLDASSYALFFVNRRA